MGCSPEFLERLVVDDEETTPFSFHRGLDLGLQRERPGALNGGGGRGRQAVRRKFSGMTIASEETYAVFPLQVGFNALLEDFKSLKLEESNRPIVAA